MSTQATPLTIPQLILSIAVSQIGVCEIPNGSNAGPDVEKYLKSIGLGKGYPWCAAFVFWVTKQAYLEGKKIESPLFKTGHVLTMWNKTDKSFRIVGQPQPGDIFIMEFKGGSGHTGFVTKVENGRIYTIEGNSNSDGSREGNMVCRKPGGRPINSIKGFLRII
jgi:hypothetical protein